MTGRMAPNARNGAAAGRGLVLVIVAVVVGLLLLRQVDGGSDGSDVATDGSDTTEGTDDTAPTDTSDPTATTAPPGTDVPATSTPDGTTPVPTTTTPDAGLRERSLVKVLVANGNTGVNGAAGRATDQVATFGYVTADATNVNDGVTYDVSVIRYEAGYAGEANRLAEDLGWEVSTDVVQPMGDVPPVDDLQASNLLIILGTDKAA